ncbi:lysophosphatidylcholine acyltransferase 3 protein nessy [Nomia melanderi]|uniref:lysophosphatidylcholine acyltransferase 3 protein nessy n=1 Tax=Nomia melanderi TaxID=2448451 RepID=UPI0013044507|nr:lysophospholipid acyltransferase 5 [Nomia melanderi]
MLSSVLLSFSNALGTSEDALRLLISILLGFPIALLHRYTLYGKSPVSQHLLFISSGLLLCYWNYGLDVIHSATSVCITYLILKFLGGTTLSVVATFVFNMSYLLYGYYETGTHDYDIKWTMPQCVLTLRLIGLAFNVLDGRQPEGKLSASQKQVALKEQPTFLEVVGFAYFPGSFLVGPQFSMKRYLDFVNGQLMADILKKGELPACVNHAVYRILMGFVYLILFQLGTSYISNEYMLSIELLKQSFLKRLLIIGFWGHVNLYKYIGCWLFSEGVCTAFGLTYTGKDEKGQFLWNGCENVKLLTFETANRFNHYIMSFNINTNNWSAEYIYKRLKFMGSKLYSQFFTLLFLALWHGFHSGYYLCFLFEFLIMYAERDVTDILNKQEKLQSFMKAHPELRILFAIVTAVYTVIFMGYSMTCFILLSHTRYNAVYSSVYYCGHIMYMSYPIVSILLKKFFLKRRPKKVD